MYISRRTSRFRQLGRFAPVADDSGLRPETHTQLSPCQIVSNVKILAMRFETKPEQERRTQHMELRLNRSEYEAVQRAAKSNNLSVAGYIRHMALKRGGRDDTEYEDQIINDLKVFRAGLEIIRERYFQKGIEPPEEGMKLYLQEGIDLLRKISK